MDQQGIRHMVIFTLKHPRGSEAESRFLSESRSILASIPGVLHFEVARQVSAKNDYDYGFTMDFASDADYERYNLHPAHVRYVEERWASEVERFLEIDFRLYAGG